MSNEKPVKLDMTVDEALARLARVPKTHTTAAVRKTDLDLPAKKGDKEKAAPPTGRRRQG